MHPLNCALASAWCHLHASDALVHVDNFALASARCHFMLRTGQFVLGIVLAGAAEPAPGRPGAWTVQFLLTIVLAGAAEPVPGRPGGWTAKCPIHKQFK